MRAVIVVAVSVRVVGQCHATDVPTAPKKVVTGLGVDFTGNANRGQQLSRRVQQPAATVPVLRVINNADAYRVRRYRDARIGSCHR